MNPFCLLLPLRACAWTWIASHYGVATTFRYASSSDDFGRYLYLPRLQNTPVLLNAIRAGLALLTWEHDGFAYAESYDESAGRYRGLRSNAQLSVTGDDTGLLVRSEIARLQIDRETGPPIPVEAASGDVPPPVPDGSTPPTPQPTGTMQPIKPKRYHGCRSRWTLRGSDAMRAGLQTKS